jgi:hypothetical protein
MPKGNREEPIAVITLLLGISHIQCSSHGEIIVAVQKAGGVFGLLAAFSVFSFSPMKSSRRPREMPKGNREEPIAVITDASEGLLLQFRRQAVSLAFWLRFRLGIMPSLASVITAMGSY